ncbi:hypothetical protein AAVH_05883 [Aphelenchoides avenae]|nr:hypothetical protein AAVH_05883 [Aphelenchus avenae]
MTRLSASQVFLVAFALTLAVEEIVGFGFGGGGGGGGCGCCCGGGGGGGCGGGYGGGGCGGGTACIPVCTSSCGRKKRAILEQQLKTEASDLCPQKEWSTLIEQNLSSDVESTKFAVQGAFVRTFETKFFVSCEDATAAHSMQFVTNGEGYCNYANDQFRCTVVALMG